MGSKKRASSDKESASSKKPRTEKNEKSSKRTASVFANADSTTLDPTLSSLFTARAPALAEPSVEAITVPVKTSRPKQTKDDSSDDAEEDGGDDDDTLSSVSEELDYSSDEEIERVEVIEEPISSEKPEHISKSEDTTRRRRKHRDDNDNLEAEHLSRVAREADKIAEKARPLRPVTSDVDMSDAASSASDDDDDTKIPQHISLQQGGDDDMQKAQRTVFVSNVSTTAIKSKSAKKELMTHMSSFFSSVTAPQTGQPAHSIESIRFRSTAYAGKIPKKAAYAKKELMDETTLSTNAYVVYSSAPLARQAAISLNGTVTLDRHIHVDEVAHPAKIDHHKCVFVGNLGFVDDESRIDAANEEEGRQVRRGRKTPSDIEEGLWRTFSKCGQVTNVRVVRDSKTRVGKGIAYVQFSDENAVEAALQYNEKKFPPMLPRKLRVSRAKAHKRNARPGADSTRNVVNANTTKLGKKGGGYVPKMTPEQQSQLGRANRLLGSQAAMRMRTGKGGNAPSGMRAPESFVFEGHRASQKSGSGARAGGNKKSKGKPTGRGAKRASAWKASDRAKSGK